MAGYDWSRGMSNNAVTAYANGERPMSRWTKAALLERATDVLVDSLEFDGSYAEARGEVARLAHFPLGFLKWELLRESSWHHTGKFFNETSFYDVDEDELLYALLHTCEIEAKYAREREYARIERKAQKAFESAGLEFNLGQIVMGLLRYGGVSESLERDICNPRINRDVLWSLYLKRKRVAVL